MSDIEKISMKCLTPILRVNDFQEAVDYYTNKLLFKLHWDWGDPPSFGCVRLDKIEIFFLPQRAGQLGNLDVNFYG